MTGPDYSTYSIDELVDVYDNIDRDAHPERFRRICAELEGHGLLEADGTLSRTRAIEETQSVQEIHAYSGTSPTPEYDKEGNYVPNKVALSTRVFNALVSILLIGYCSFGVYRNDLYIPGKRGDGVHLTDNAAIVMSIAILCGVIVLLTQIADHYDKRDNEQKYYEFAKSIRYLGIGIAVLAIVINCLS